WELYNLNEDWNETTDLAKRYPEKLEELKKLFDEEAKKYNVYPLKNYREGLAGPEIKSRAVIYEGTTVKTRVAVGKGPVTLTASIDVTDDQNEGVIFSNGGLVGGSTLYVKNKTLYYVLNDGVKETSIVAGKISKGKHVLRLEYVDNAVAVFVNDKEAARQTVSGRNRYLGTIGSDGISLGRDLNSPVTKAYEGTYPFTGIVRSIVVEQKTDKSL